MKKIFYYIFASIMLLGLSSCAKEIVATEEEETHGMTLIARLGGSASTKATLVGDSEGVFKALWSENDSIKVYSKEDHLYHVYKLTRGAGTMVGKFYGPDDMHFQEEGFALYGTGFTYAETSGFLRSDQYCTSVDNALSLPMVAKVDVYSTGQAEVYDFKNVCGLLSLNLKGVGTIKKIKLTTDQYISGIVTLDNNYVLKVNQGIIGSYKYVTLDCGENGIEIGSEAKPFYISLPQGEYTGVKIEITDIVGRKAFKTLKADKSINIVRSQIKNVNLTVDDFYFPNELPGKFWVSSTSKVKFSRGNLRFDTTTNTFEFCKYQREGGDGYTWSEDATTARNKQYDGEEDERFLFTNKKATTPNEKFVVNGEKGVYRTLSRAEWIEFVNRNSHVYGVKVLDVDNCAIFYPIDYDGPRVNNSDKTTFTDKATWMAAEAAGALCFTSGVYWTSDLRKLERLVQYEGMVPYWNCAQCFEVTGSYARFQVNGVFFGIWDVNKLRLVKATD